MSRERNNNLERKKKAEEGYLWCNRCNKFLQYSKFSKLDCTGNFGHNYYCKSCVINYNRAHGYQSKACKTASEKYHANRKHFIDLFGGKCSRCGFSDGYWALQFHHVHPTRKLYNPNKLMHMSNREKSLRELNKCILLCANCHITINKSWKADFIPSEYGYIIFDESKVEEL